MMKEKIKLLDHNFNLFAFKGNLVILLCNQSIKRLKVIKAYLFF